MEHQHLTCFEELPFEWDRFSKLQFTIFFMILVKLFGTSSLT